MKNEKLHRAMTDIDDKIILEADDKKKKSVLLKYLPIAAALAFVIGVAAILTVSRPSESARFSLTDFDFGNFRTVVSGDRNVVVYEKKDIEEQITEFFESGDKAGFIARITPTEYRFYYDIKEDGFTNTPYIDGYAECICEINKVSSKYNLSNVSDGGKITVRLDLYLSPSNDISDETFMDLMTDMGAYKNGKTNTGIFAVPAKYVNENDFEILMTHDPRGALPLNESFYAFINSDTNGLYWFSYVCPTSDTLFESLKWDDDIKQSALNFRAYVSENDKSLAE